MNENVNLMNINEVAVFLFYMKHYFQVQLS